LSVAAAATAAATAGVVVSFLLYTGYLQLWFTFQFALTKVFAQCNSFIIIIIIIMLLPLYKVFTLYT
jgi:hypothetical protein